MMAALILLSWCFLVACACVLGLGQDTVKAEKERKRQLDISRALAREVEIMKRNAAVLLRYADSDREYKSFDQVLRGLPKECTGHQHLVRQLELLRYDYVAHFALTETVPTAEMVTKLAFDSETVWMNNREYQALETQWLAVNPRRNIGEG